MKAIEQLIHQRQYAEAEQQLRLAIEATPQQAQNHYLLGTVKYFQGQIGPSIEHLKKALHLQPQHTDAAICLSVLLNDLGKYNDAKQVFHQANQSIQQKTLDPTVDRKFAAKHSEIADLYMRYRRYEEALAQYEIACRLQPESTDTRIKLAKALSKKGHSLRAIQELQQLKKEFPRDLSVRIQLGLLHYSQNNLLDAELEWEQVLALDPHNEEAKNYLNIAKEGVNSLTGTKRLDFT